MIYLYWKVLTTRYAQFSGRAGRREYWLFHLAHFTAYFIILTAPVLMKDVDHLSYGILALFFYILLTLPPLLSLNVRRLHDIGWSGWWSLMYFVPLGPLILMIFAIKPGDDGDNAYGPPSEAPSHSS